MNRRLRHYRLFWNDFPIKPEQPIRFFPGGCNRLRVETESPLLDSVVARLEVIAPDGRIQSRSLSLAQGKAETDMGRFCVPAEYEYEAGVVYRCGYRCRITIEDNADKSILAHFAMAAVCSRDPDAEWLLPGAPDRCVYNDGYIPEQPPPGQRRKSTAHWDPFDHSAAAMQPPLQLRLDPAVLVDRNRVTLWYRTRPEPAVAAMQARLRVHNPKGRDILDPVEVAADAEWRSWSPDVSQWPSGKYTLELQPAAMFDGALWEDGPRLEYRRKADDHLCVQISPYAPYGLRRDVSRDEIMIDDWPVPLPEGWQTDTCGMGTALLCNGNPASDPVLIDYGLQGHYAIFALPVNNIMIRAGKNEVMRRIHEPERPEFGELFVTVADLTDQAIELHANDLDRIRSVLEPDADLSEEISSLYAGDGTRPTPFDPTVNGGEVRSGIRHLRLVPVTPRSVSAFRKQTANPPYELRGVDDWWCYFQGADRVDPGQIDAIVRGQRELGIKVLNWAVGRSWVQYPSRLPDAQMFPCTPLNTSQATVKRYHAMAWSKILRSCDCLGYPLEHRNQYNVRIQGWLAMNRHYAPNYSDGYFTSNWAREHQDYCLYNKRGNAIDVSRMEYYFPEVRKERLDILEEVAGYGPDGLVIGCCRQPPMAGYNPTMVAAYKEKTGVDPATIDIDDGQPYLDWIKWRSGFFTELLRELSHRLDLVEKKIGYRVPVVARVPGIGLPWNLAQGMDVSTWIREGLIDELQLDPLECAAGQASHDVRPYLELCRAQGIPVFGGVNTTTGINLGCGRDDYTPATALRRAIGLLQAGVDGIELYEAEIMSRGCERRWLIPLLADPARAQRWLAESNIDAVFPITARNAALGHDNHWFAAHQTLHGAHNMPRGTKQAL